MLEFFPFGRRQDRVRDAAINIGPCNGNACHALAWPIAAVGV
jgi:hypothetical protein